MAESQPFIAVPEELIGLVAEGIISARAAWLYVSLLSHLKRRDSAEAWPTRGRLASMMGFKKPETVDRYLDELIACGLVKKERRWRGKGYDSNRYTLGLVHEGGPQTGTTRLPSGPQTGTRVVRVQGPPVVRKRGLEVEEVEVEEISRGRVCPHGHPGGITSRAAGVTVFCHDCRPD